MLTMNLIQVSCSKRTVNYQLKTLEIVKFVTFLSQNDNMLVHMCSLRRLLLTTTRRVPPPRNCVLSVRNNKNVVEAIAHYEVHLVQTLRATSLLRRGKFFWIDICAVQIYNLTVNE